MWFFVQFWPLFECRATLSSHFSAGQKLKHDPCHDFCIILCAKRSNGKKEMTFATLDGSLPPPRGCSVQLRYSHLAGLALMTFDLDLAWWTDASGISLNQILQEMYLLRVTRIKYVFNTFLINWAVPNKLCVVACKKTPPTLAIRSLPWFLFEDMCSVYSNGDYWTIHCPLVWLFSPLSH